MTQPTVFISYSHKDEPWKDRLVTHLDVLQRQGLLDLWDDRRISAGAEWYPEIRQAIDRARVAVLLVSADFLTSDFILGEEVPRLLQRRDEEGLRVFPVIVRPCAWQRVKWLARMQARPRDGRPLSAGDEHQVDADLAAIAEEIASIVSPAPEASKSPTASELRRFRDEDFQRLKTALHDVWDSLGTRSPAVNYAAAHNWELITSRFTDIPEDIRATFDEVVKARKLAKGRTSKLTREQLSSAKQGINQVLRFLHQRFPAAGVELPSPRTEVAAPGAARGSTLNDDRADFVIITALEKEAKAIVRRLDNHSIKRFEDRDIRTYHCGTIPIQDSDQVYRVVVVLLPSMGEISAANAVTDAMARWDPRFVLMVGIAGGLPQDDLDLGDVVVADQIIGYEYGKVTEDGFEPRDRVYPVSALLLDRVRNFWDDRWTQQVNVPRPENAHRETSKLFAGPIASGNKVIASTEFRQQLKTRWPKLIALEMEGEGVFAAVFDRPQIGHALVIRSICDMADERKSDEWQEYAANAAAAFVAGFLRNGPVEPRAVAPESVPSEADLEPEERAPSGPEKISLAKLPSTDPVLFGREGQLATLDAAWDRPQTHVVSLVAWGGVGKTALVNKWLLGMGQDGYRGAERVYGWSFYSQGAAEGKQASADPFIAAALAWFGDPDPTAGSPWQKGERLAELVRQHRTLLILDGLEPLQYPPGEMEGQLKDPGLQCLLRALARHNPGLCVVTTRLAVDDIKDFVGSSVKRTPLEHLSPEAGAAYLEHLGVKGTQKELKQAAGEFGGHALALTLLGRYLAVAYDGDVRQRDRVPGLTQERKRGGHARRVMASYERWFRNEPELDILHVMGLFDRPAESGAIQALRAEPPIEGLTEKLQELSEADWRFAVDNLRRVRLLAGEDPHNPGTLDCHPLVREHFGEQLEAGHPEAWRQAHGRLYEYYKSQAPHQPDTLEEMMPLYAAVAHGCRAGRHQEALMEVYWERVLRGDEHFSWRKLGAFGADLAALSGFFDPPWRKPVDAITEAVRGFALGQAGLYLRALGRLAEAAQPMQAGMEAIIEQEDWRNAAQAAGNLSELHLTIGDLAQALETAHRSVDLADRSGDWGQRIITRTALADALHQAGRLDEAGELLREAEAMQEEHQPQFPLLYSVQGYRYCDLLLSRGEASEVLRRAKQTVEWAKQAGGSLLTIALDHLSLGRAHLLQAQREGTDDPSASDVPSALRAGLTQAATHLNRAVDGLRQAGTQHHIPRGLLARAALHRAQGQFARAQRDLEEALTIAARGGMRLHEADCHLESARLHLAQGEQAQARDSLSKARAMVEETGYHRRDGEVAALGELLGAEAPPARG